MTRRHRQRDDAGLVLLTTVTKVLLTLSIVGAIGYDSLSILTTQYSVRDDALAAAQIGHDALHSTGTASAAYAAVLAYAKEHGDIVVHQGLSKTSPRKNTWTVELKKQARTMVASHVPSVKNYVVATASSSASDPLN